MITQILLVIGGFIMGYYAGNKDFRTRTNTALKIMLSKKKPETKQEQPKVKE